MKKLLLICCTIAIAGCTGTSGSGSLSGPGAGPVELPAPVVGRIDAGTPDATGKSTITGAANAVEPNSIVMAINERLETTSALWKATDALFPKAYAQTFPSICGAAGHACTISAADGSFTLQIEASIGDTIFIVLIDESGAEISPRISLIVPATSTVLQAGECAGQGVTGTLKDMINVDGIPIALKDGDEQYNNRLIVGDITIPLPGCSAKMLVVTPPGTDDGSIVALLQDGTLWSARWDGISSLYAANEAAVSINIVAMAPMGNPDHVVAAIHTTSAGFAVARLSLSTGGTDQSTPVPIPAGHTNEEVLALRTMGPFAGNGYLGVVATRSPAAGVNDYYVTLFETDAFTIANTLDLPLPINTASIVTPTTNDVADVMLTVNDSDQSYADIFLLFTDPQNRLMRALQVVNGNPTPAKFRTSTNVKYLNDLYLTFAPLNDRTPDPTNLVPGKFSVGFEKKNPVAYTLVDDPSNVFNLWVLADMIDPVGLPPQANYGTTIPDATDPKFISVNGDTKTVFAGDLGSNDIVEANSLWLSDVF